MMIHVIQFMWFSINLCHRERVTLMHFDCHSFKPIYSAYIRAICFIRNEPGSQILLHLNYGQGDSSCRMAVCVLLQSWHKESAANKQSVALYGK